MEGARPSRVHVLLVRRASQWGGLPCAHRHRGLTTQAKPWTCLLIGHDAVDPFAAEADRKRLLLERFQSEHSGFDFSDSEVTLSGAHVPDPSTFMK